MSEAILSLPILLGCLVFMALTTAAGLAVYYLTSRQHAERHSDGTMEEVKEATNNLTRVVGWLLTLLITMTFTDVVGELVIAETTIEGEAAAI